MSLNQENFPNVCLKLERRKETQILATKVEAREGREKERPFYVRTLLLEGPREDQW